MMLELRPPSSKSKVTPKSLRDSLLVPRGKTTTKQDRPRQIAKRIFTYFLVPCARAKAVASISRLQPIKRKKSVLFCLGLLVPFCVTSVI